MGTRLGWSTLTPAMEAALAEVVRGQAVFDFGCGQGELADWMALHGAASVTAIDKEATPKFRSKKVTGVRTQISNAVLPDRIDVGVTAWPVNRAIEGLVPALRHCDTVVYLGCNDATTMCWPPDLFPYLLTRELLAYLPHHQNNMVIVGQPLPDGQMREPTPEEALAIQTWESVQSLPSKGLSRFTLGRLR